MKNYYLGLFALLMGLALFATACEDDDNFGENGSVSIDFRSVFNDTDLNIQADAYDYPDGSKLKVSLFQYYISDLSFIAADGNTVGLSDIELIRYNTANASNVQTLSFDNVPVGDYTAVRFGIGVKPDLNNMLPSDFAADAVLNEAEWWNENIGFVFTKIEGNADLNNDGTFDTPVSFHLGRDDLYTTLTFSGNFSVSEDGTTNFEIEADVFEALAASSTDFYDFTIENQRIIHGGNQAVAVDIWTRLTEQFRLSIR